MNLIAVVVTYNRLDLLKKCINAIKHQTQKPNKIIIINNSSTDGTEEWLSTQPYISITQPNLGGAAGFSRGIKEAYIHGADWMWLMDDDTIPQNNALEKLVATLSIFPENTIGFLSSNVLWTDGKPHKMNRTWPFKENKLPKHLEGLKSRTKLPLIQWGTFVSMLLSAEAVEKVGLPIKEFFIWCDDVEYSTRIIKNGMAGVAVPDSIVIHETPVNHESNIFKDNINDLWKFRYGLRNELYNKRMHYGEKQFWRLFIRRLTLWPAYIIYKRKPNKWKLIKLIWQSTFDALSFKPAIEKVGRIKVQDTRKTRALVNETA